jgi:hypothetical protein
VLTVDKGALLLVDSDVFLHNTYTATAKDKSKASADTIRQRSSAPLAFWWPTTSRPNVPAALYRLTMP